MSLKTEIKFNANRAEQTAIQRIARRAQKHDPELDYQSLLMDLEACHSNGNPLDFQRLEKFDDFNFCHDVFGIVRHLDRNNGKLINFFSPRCSKH